MNDDVNAVAHTVRRERVARVALCHAAKHLTNELDMRVTNLPPGAYP